MRVALVAMPWHAVNRPSLALGLLAALIRERTDAEVTQHPAYLDWLRLTLDADLDPPVTVADHDHLAEHSFFHGVGDWVFAAELAGTGPEDTTGYLAHLRSHGVDPGAAPRLRALAAGFLDQVAAEVLATGAEVIGCSSTFLQQTASLALLQRVKALAPQRTTVLGGANCEGPMGAAVLRHFPFVDVVVRGEGEPTLPALLAALDCPDGPDRDAALAAIPGLCWRGPDPIVNPAADQPWHGLAENPMPDHRPYFDRVARLGLEAALVPEVVFEASRGCWWGEKHHCTFCGLNGRLLTSRVRPAERVAAEVSQVVADTGVRRFAAADNILAREHVADLLPRLATIRPRLSIHVETRSNLSDPEVRALADAGVDRIQTGLESLLTPVLQRMRKGVTAVQNLRTLRRCQQHGVRLSWNLLYGFPGEPEEAYRALIAAMPALWHLTPPAGAFRITLERFSPYHRDLDLGFRTRRPAGFLRHLYPELSDAELAELAYLFDTPPQGIDGEVVTQLEAAVARWQTAHRRAYLVLSPRDDRDIITDGRQGLRVLTLTDPTERRLFRVALDGTSVGALQREHPDAERYLARWETAKLVHRDEHRLVALPLVGR